MNHLPNHDLPEEQEHRLAALDAFVEFTEVIGTSTDTLVLARHAVDVLLTRFPTGTGAYYEPEGNAWKLRVWSEDLEEQLGAALRDRGLPGSTPPVSTVLHTREADFIDHWDPRTHRIERTEAYGMAVNVPIIVENDVRGIIAIGVRDARRWTPRDRSLVRAVARGLTLALERSDASERLQDRNRQLQAARTRGDVLAALGDALQSAGSPGEVARLALERLGPALDATGMTMVRLLGEQVRATIEWGNVPEHFRAALTNSGFRLTAVPDLLRVTRTREPLYFGARQAAPTGSGVPSDAGAAFPMITPGGSLVGFVLAWRSALAGTWTDGHRELLSRAAGTLALALERAEHTRELAEEREALAVRNRALAAFEEWSRELALDADPMILIRRAQDLLHDLLPAHATPYYEREGDRWYVKSIRGDFGNDELRRAHEAGLPHAETANLRVACETGETYYQDVYDPSTDRMPDAMRHVSATAMLPLCTHRGVRGIIGVSRFGVTGWSTAERVVIETVRRSLELALDRADKAAELEAEREALLARTAELAAANDELEAFAYSVSHDLRTPVRHIAGFNALLRRNLGERLDDRSDRYLEVVADAAGRMNVLIDAMLGLSRASRVPLRLGPVDLGAVVMSVIAELEPEVANRQVEWRVSPLPAVTADHDTLRQVVLNLLSNAVKYTSPRPAAVIEVWAEDREGEWAVYVRDNGVGFDPRYQERLFGVFQRLHRPEEFDGVGVGLANVRRIVQRHGGGVAASGAPGAGSTFSFTLPQHD